MSTTQTFSRAGEFEPICMHRNATSNLLCTRWEHHKGDHAAVEIDGTVRAHWAETDDLTTQLARIYGAAFDSVARDSTPDSPRKAGIVAVLEHLQSAGRLIPAGGMALTAEQVEDVRIVLGLNGSQDIKVVLDAQARLRALFPATEPAEAEGGTIINGLIDCQVNYTLTAEEFADFLNVIWEGRGDYSSRDRLREKFPTSEHDVARLQRKSADGDCFEVCEGHPVGMTMAHILLHEPESEPAEGVPARCTESIGLRGTIATCELEEGHGGRHFASDEAPLPAPAEPAEEETKAERPSFPTIQDVPNDTLFHTHGGEGSSLFVRNLDGQLKLYIGAPEMMWSSAMGEEAFTRATGPFVEVPWSALGFTSSLTAREETRTEPFDVNALVDQVAQAAWRERERAERFRGDPTSVAWDALPEWQKQDEYQSIRGALTELQRLGLLTLPSSSPVVPAPTETGPWQTWQEVPEGVWFLTNQNIGCWMRRDGDKVTTVTGGWPVCTDSLVAQAPFVAAEEG